VCEGHVFSIIFWSRKYAYKLTPLFHSGEGDEAEKIKFEIEKFPCGLVQRKDSEELETTESTRLQESKRGS